MQLTILGCYGPYPPAGGACSGYLVREAGYNILLDCGNGVLSRLQEFIDYKDLDAVILSHLHADHFSDLMIMRYGLELAHKRSALYEPLLLYTPIEPAVDFDRLPYKNAYSVKALYEDLQLKIGPFTITASPGVHAVPSFSLRLETPTAVLVYSGDTEITPNLAPFAKSADLFLCEANYLEEEIVAGLSNHLSAAQAAAIAAEAGVKRLILTHLHPERESAPYLAEAHKYFTAADLAGERITYSL